MPRAASPDEAYAPSGAHVNGRSDSGSGSDTESDSGAGHGADGSRDSGADADRPAAPDDDRQAGGQRGAGAGGRARESSGQSPPHPTPRLHAGGKLSFRRRVPHVDTAGLPYLIGGDDPPPLSTLVPAGYRDIEIEVGPGKGTFLLAAAAAQPHVFHLGIEAAPAYAQFAADRVQRAGLANVLLLVDNARLYLEDRVEPGSVSRLHVYFPDPWPKRRHRKRRLFTETAPALVHRVLRPDGWLLVSTDNAAYAGQICSVLGSSLLLARDEHEEERLAAMPPGHGFSPTSFEAKYRAEGRAIRRYAFRRV